MKRRTKLFLFLTSLLILGVVGVVLMKIQQNASMPFPGAVVLLDDASWNSRYTEDTAYGYLWTADNVIVYKQCLENNMIVYKQPHDENATRFRVVRQRVEIGKKLPDPEILSKIVLKDYQEMQSVSPDGKTLSVTESIAYPTNWRCTLIPLEAEAKPVVIAHPHAAYLLWSADSRFLYTMDWMPNKCTLLCFDAHNGNLVKTPLSEGGALTHITSDGKLLDFEDRQWKLLKQLDWEVSEFQGSKTVVVKSHHQPYSRGETTLDLSPSGDRLLWQIQEKEETFFERLQRRLLKRTIPPVTMIQWEVTDLDGNNRRPIGFTRVPQNKFSYTRYDPQWTPDGKGVHFVQDGKLMYLAVP